MNQTNLYTCCFCGHRKINRSPELESGVLYEIEKLINNGVHTFLFGSKSEFDDLCYETVTELKEKYPYIKRIYVRAEYPYINEVYKKYLLGKYEDTYYPETLKNAGKALYIKRNFEMIDNSRYIICYYDKSYQPTKGKSGTETAISYAVKRKLAVINLAVSPRIRCRDRCPHLSASGR